MSNQPESPRFYVEKGSKIKLLCWQCGRTEVIDLKGESVERYPLDGVIAQIEEFKARHQHASSIPPMV